MSEERYETLRLQRRGAVLHVVLNRPDVHDAFDERMIADLTDAFRRAADMTDVRVLLLRSTGKHFSAGADLEWMRRAAAAGEEENLEDAGRLEDMLRAIATCPKPVVARIQGAALGGGAGLVCAADFAVASERAFLGFSEVRLGILPAVISPYVLRKIPAGTAQSLFLSGNRFGAAEARRLGLVDRVVEEERLDEAVEELVEDLLQCSPAAQAAVKELVESVRGRTLEEARAVTTRAIAEIRASEEGRRGVAAFLEEREPPWVPGSTGDGPPESPDDAEADGDPGES